MALSALGMWATAVLGGWGLVRAGARSGIGPGLAQPALLVFCTDLVPDQARGSAMATMSIVLEIGIGLGVIGGGVVGQALGLLAMFGLAGLAPALGAGLVLAMAHDPSVTPA